MQLFKSIVFLSVFFISLQGYSEIESHHVTINSKITHFLSKAEDNPIEIFSPDSNIVFKRGEVIEIRWSGGNPNDKYALDLFDGRYHYRHVGELNNSGVYPWIIPKDVSPGKEYRFKLTNTNDFSEYSFGETFIIKRKVPIVAWIIPGGLVITGILVILLNDDPSNEPNDLPVPIDP